MKKTVLITGASSGIGKAAALYFAQKGWLVAAAMRNPQQRQTGLENAENIKLVHMDVLDLNSVKSAVGSVHDSFGNIDAVVNNAGYAVHGPFEASSREDVLKQFNTNVTGLMDVCREVIPLLRKQGSGAIINIASIGGKVGFPYYSLYNSTKFAVEGFSEALSYELRQFGIRVKLVEPGIILTDFYNRSMVAAKKEGLTAYDAGFEAAEKKSGSFMRLGSKPEAAARVIYKAAMDKGDTLRYSVGFDALAILAVRKILPDYLFYPFMKNLNGV